MLCCAESKSSNLKKKSHDTFRDNWRNYLWIFELQIVVQWVFDLECWFGYNQSTTFLAQNILIILAINCIYFLILIGLGYCQIMLRSILIRNFFSIWKKVEMLTYWLCSRRLLESLLVKLVHNTDDIYIVRLQCYQ